MIFKYLNHSFTLSEEDRSCPVSNPPADVIAELLKKEQFTRFGFAELKTPLSLAIYESWLNEGMQGEMSYLARHLEDKKDPKRLLPRAKNAIVVTMNYVPHPEPITPWPLSEDSKIAAYAKGEDYHFIFRRRLERVVTALRALYPCEEFIYFSDSGPVMERDLAVRAGLGWIGKNTCVIDRTGGSLFLLAEIYTTLDLPLDPSGNANPHDFCGSCTRCMDACPTGALVEPRKLDARLCISYLTIESRQVPELSLREKMDGWLFGCDICQTVCPWNIKFSRSGVTRSPGTGASHVSSHVPSSENLVRDLRFLMTTSGRGLERAFAGTPLMRAGGFGLKRNALLVAVHYKLRELVPEIKNLRSLQAADAKLTELIDWALDRLAPS
jgi:epoxyqueuosine reductase